MFAARPLLPLVIGLTCLGCLTCLTWAPAAAAAATIELTPAGDEICCDPSDYAIRGYRFTVSEGFSAYGVEWLIELPAGASIAARVRGPADELLLEGPPTVGDGTEQWYRAEFEYTFEVGQTYDVLVYVAAPNEALFRRSAGNCCDNVIPPYLTAVESRSSQGEVDGPSTTYNTWPAFMRLVLDAPDSDGDGVADAADACPDTPAGELVGADGCPMASDTTGDATTGDTSGAPPPTSDTGAPGPTDAASTGDTGGTMNSGDDAATAGGAPEAGGCGCTSAPAGLPWAMATLLAIRRPRRKKS